MDLRASTTPRRRASAAPRPRRRTANCRLEPTMTDTAPRHPRPDFGVRQDRPGRVRRARSPATASSSSRPAAPPRRSPTPASRCIDVSELTGFPEMMDGRVKTLHPEGAWRPARRSATTPSTRRRCRRTASAPIDLLVVNLYPFEATVAKGADFDDCIENIDIGGPAMIRAAAKNHADVAVVVEPDDYAARARRARRRTTARPRSRCARSSPPRPMPAPPPTTRRSPTGSRSELDEPAPGLPRVRRQARRGAALRREPAPDARRSIARREHAPGVATARQVQGKELSYNNINDTDAAYECVAEFDPQAHRRLRHHQARQSVRRRRRREPASRPTARRWPAIRSRPSAASSRSTARSTPRPRARSPRSSPR